MKLASLLTPEHVILDLKGSNTSEVLQNIMDYLVDKRLLQAKLSEPMLKALNDREDMVSTGLGSGVAIPHIFSESIDDVVAVFARSIEGVDFEALDNALVHFVILLIVPQKDQCKHLQTLATIAKMFKTCDVRQHLHAAECSESVIRIINGCDSH